MPQTDVHSNEVDTRPLSEKLADHIQPVHFTLDLSEGNEAQIIGTPHDIDRVKAACKAFMKRVESDRLDINNVYTISISARDQT